MKLNRDELALRMLEASIGFRRPPNMTAAEAFECGPKNLRDAYARASVAALQYFIECAGPLTIIGSAIKPSPILSEWSPPTESFPEGECDSCDGGTGCCMEEAR